MAQRCRFKVGKLIRDKQSKTLQDSGVEVDERIMGLEEFAQRLKEKILEEGEEVVKAVDLGELQEEMADLLEVMMALARLNGFTLEEVKQKALEKKLERGGFDARIYSGFVDIDPDHPNVKYYRAHPDKYPEIFDR